MQVCAKCKVMSVTTEKIIKMYEKFDSNSTKTAEKIGCSQAQIYNVVKGNYKDSNNYSLPFIKKVAEAYKQHFPSTKFEEVEAIKEALDSLNDEQINLVKAMLKQIAPDSEL